MTPEQTARAKKLARDHWQYLATCYEKAFTDGFIHGYKHALEEKEQQQI